MNKTRIPEKLTAGTPLESAETEPSEFLVHMPTTGTVDDADAPGDEHERENEAETRETSDDTESPEEFERDDDPSNSEE
jgi:hypothetical protein